MNSINPKDNISKKALSYLRNKNEWNDYDVVYLYQGQRIYLINTPLDGWCLLYSFQLAYFAEYDIFLAIDDIRNQLIHQFKEMIHSNNNFQSFFSDPSGSEDQNQEVELPFEKLLISKYWQDESKNNLQINTFNILRYIEEKQFATSVVDLIPFLLANAFNCIIKLYQLEENDLYFSQEHCSFAPIKTKNSDETKEISILMVKENQHYMALANKSLEEDDLLMVSEANDNYQTIIASLLNDPVFGEIAKHFKSNSEILNEKPNIEIFYCNIPSELIARLDDEASLHQFPISSMYDCLSHLYEQLKQIYPKNTDCPNLAYKFCDKNSFINAVYANDIHELEQSYLKCFFVLIHNDLYYRIEDFSEPVSYEKMEKAVNIVLRKFFTLIIKVCSLRFLYSKLTIHWATDMGGLNYSIVLPTHGILVDDEIKHIRCHVFWNESLHEYCFRLVHNLDHYKSTHLNYLQDLYDKGDTSFLIKSVPPSRNEPITTTRLCPVKDAIHKESDTSLNDSTICHSPVFLVIFCLFILLTLIAILFIIIY